MKIKLDREQRRKAQNLADEISENPDKALQLAFEVVAMRSPKCVECGAGISDECGRVFMSGPCPFRDARNAARNDATDAARYRWIRDANAIYAPVDLLPTLQGPELDVGIDLQIQGSPYDEGNMEEIAKDAMP